MHKRLIDVNDKFNWQPTLKGANISLRPLVVDDFDELYICASDKDIWAGHPHPTRYQLDEFRPYFHALIESNACVAIIDNSSGKMIGTSKYYSLSTTPNDISIGFTFLAKKHWGGKTNSELKTLMLDYAFNYFNTVWFHVGPSNIRSQKATLKIGATFTGEHILNISGKDEPWYCYKITKDEWSRKRITNCV